MTTILYTFWTGFGGIVEGPDAILIADARLVTIFGGARTVATKADARLTDIHSAPLTN